MATSKRPTGKQLKIIRKVIKSSYDDDNDRKAEWKALYDTLRLDSVYGKDPNKTNSDIGKEAVHHLLGSYGIREELSDNTPIHHPSIIPKECNLHFWLLKSIHYNGSFVFDGIDLAKHGYRSLGGFNLCDRFNNTAEMKNIFDLQNYSSKLSIGLLDTKHHFWVKNMKQNGSALVRAFGVEVSTYIMRYRQAVCIQIGAAMVVISNIQRTDRMDKSHPTAGAVGVGFCNLTQSKKTIKGHQMLHFDQETMDQIHFEFYSRNNISIHDISVSVMTYKVKSNQLVQTREDALDLFNGKQYLYSECIVTDNPHHNRSIDHNYNMQISNTHSSLYQESQTEHEPMHFEQILDVCNESTSTISSTSYDLDPRASMTPFPVEFNPYPPSPTPFMDHNHTYDNYVKVRTFQSSNQFGNMRYSMHINPQQKQIRRRSALNQHINTMRKALNTSTILR